MSSGIVQLVCIGAQDEHIVGDLRYHFSTQPLKDIPIFHNPLKSKLYTEL